VAEGIAAAFFSYCRNDSDFALRLASDLKAAGARVWLDQLDIVPGEPWDRAVEDALNKCSRMLVLLSPASVNSANVMDEVSFALEEKKIVIPVIYMDCTVPFRLRRLQHVDLRQDYARGIKELLKILLPGQPPGESPLPIPASHPEQEPKQLAQQAPPPSPRAMTHMRTPPWLRLWALWLVIGLVVASGGGWLVQKWARSRSALPGPSPPPTMPDCPVTIASKLDAYGHLAPREFVYTDGDPSDAEFTKWSVTFTPRIVCTGIGITPELRNQEGMVTDAYIKTRVLAGKSGEYNTTPKMRIFFDDGNVGNTEYLFGGINPVPIPTGAKQVTKIEMDVSSGNNTRTTLRWP